MSSKQFMQTALKNHDSISNSKWNLFLGFIGLKQSPFVAAQYRLGPAFYRWHSSTLLCLSLILTAVLFNSFLPILAPAKQLIDAKQPCTNPNAFLNLYANKFNNITNLQLAITQSSRADNTSKALFQLAERTHQPITNANYKWPQPFQPTAEDQARLEREANRVCVKENCADVTVDGGILGSQTKTICNTVEFPCADPNALKALSTGETVLEQKDLLGSDSLSRQIDGVASKTNSTTNPSLRNADFQQQMLEQLTVLQYRVNLIGSLYVFYLAVSIYLGAPYTIAFPPFLTRIQTVIGGVTKLQYILFVILIWYSVEYITLLLALPDFNLILANISANPCWLNTAVASQFYNQTTRLCTQLVDSQNLYNNAIQSIDFYRNVEKTWVRAGQPAVYPPTTATLNLLYNGTTCTQTDVYKQLLQTNAKADFLGMIFSSGILARFLLQPILAHLIIALFQVIAPVCSTAGRVLLPLDVFAGIIDGDEGIKMKLETSIYEFVRTRNWIWVFLNTVLLCLVCYGVSGSIGVFIGVCIGIVAIVAGCIWLAIRNARKEKEKVGDYSREF